MTAIGPCYGGHSTHLLFHIIILEFQCFIPDSSPKKIIRARKCLLGIFIFIGCIYIYWAHLYLLGVFIYSVQLDISIQLRVHTSITNPRCTPARQRHPLFASARVLHGYG